MGKTIQGQTYPAPPLPPNRPRWFGGGFRRSVRRELDPRHRQLLDARAVDPEVAAERGYFSVDAERARALRHRGSNARDGLAIPIHTVHGDEWAAPWTQLRPDAPAEDAKSGKARKYLRPAGSETVVDVHPRSLGRLRDVDAPVAITEGIPKADALTSVGFVALGLLGVDCWVGNGGTVLPDLKHLAWRGRQVYIAFDRDVLENDRVKRAARGLADELARRGADVHLAVPPPVKGKDKTGWDDYLAALPRKARTQRAVIDRAEPIEAALGGLRSRLDVAVASDVAPETVTFLWPPFVPDRKLTIVDGPPGAKKTYLALAVAAAASRGGTLPGGSDGAPVAVERGRTLFFTMEDGHADTIRPRFDALGGDPSRLLLVTGLTTPTGDSAPFTLADLGALDAALAEHRPRLVVFDPLLGYLGSGVDAHRSNETRPILAELGRLAESHGTAIVGIRHTRKAAREGGAVYAGLGSVDFTAAARSVLLVALHPTRAGVSVLAHTKSSTTEAGPTLEYALDDAGRIEWLGTSELSADDLVAPPRKRGRPASAREAATEWLLALLRETDGGVIDVTRAIELGAEAGHTEVTLRRTAKELRERGALTLRNPTRGKKSRWALAREPR